MKITKSELYHKLHDELYKALPQVAHDCDVSVSEAICDKFDKRYDDFHKKASEIIEVYF